MYIDKNTNYTLCEEVVPSEHPDAAKFSQEVKRRFDEIVKERRKKRIGTVLPKFPKAETRNISFRKEDIDIQERSMSSSEIDKEEKLKKKYDDSEMKENFIKQYGEKKGKQYYFAYIRKKAMAEAVELLDEAKRTRAERLQANIEKDKKRTRGGPRYDTKGKRLIRGKLRIYDWDRALAAAPEAKVRVVNKNTGAVEHRLTDTEHYSHHAAGMLKPHQKYDFSEFGNAEQLARGRTNPKIIKRLKKEIKRGKPFAVVSARAGSVASGMNRVLARHGIKPGRGKLHLTGDMPHHIPTPERKNIVFKHLLKKHPSGGIFIDDYVPNVEAAKKHPKLKALLAQPNERGEVMARTHRQQRAEDFELWIENLLDEGYDLSDFTVDELYEAFEFYMNQLNEDLSTKVRGAASAVTKGIFNQNVPQNSGTLNRTLNAASQVAGGVYRGLVGRETSSTNPVAQYANQNARGSTRFVRNLSPVNSDLQNKLWRPGSALARGALLNEPTTSSNLRDKIANAAGRGIRGVVSRMANRISKNESIEFEYWVNSLIDEGYDLSDFTVDELYEAFDELLDEAMVAAPGDESNHKKSKKYVKKPKPLIDYKSPYGGKNIKKIEETIELTPYEYWKSFIAEDENDEYDGDLEDCDFIEEEIDVTPYDLWKVYFSEKYVNEDKNDDTLNKD